MQKSRLYAKIIVNLLVSFALVLFVIFIVPKMIQFFIPFVLAYIISSIVNPIVKFMENRIKIIRKHGSAIVIVASIIMILGLLYLILSVIIREVISLVNDIPYIARELTIVLEEISTSLSRLGERLPKTVTGVADTLGASIEEFLLGFFNGIEMPAVFETASGYVKSIANIFLLTIVTIIASYFFTVEREKMGERFRKIFPASFYKGYRMVIDHFKNAVGGYFKAQFKIMLVLTVMMWITFQIMGIKYAIIIALLIAFIDLLPVFGTGAVLWPWAIISIITGEYIQAVVLIVLYVVCQLTKQLLQPKLVGDSIGVSPMAALVFMFMGYRLFGVFGMIIGIPVGMILVSFYQSGVFDRIIKGFKIILTDIDEFRKF